MPAASLTLPRAPGARVASLLRSHWGALAALVPLALIEIALDGGLTLSYRYLIDEAIIPQNARMLGIVLGALGAAAILAPGVAVLRDRAYAKRVATILDDIRRAVFDHVQALSLGAIQRRRSGDIVARFSTDLAGFEGALVGGMGGLLLPGLGVIMGVALLFVVLDWRIALGASLVWPLVLVGPRLVAPRAAAAAYEKKERESDLLVVVGEIVEAHRTIKAFGLRSFVDARFRSALLRTSDVTARATFLGSLVERTTVGTIYAMQVAAVAAGSFLAYRRELSVGVLVSFLTIFWNLGWSIVVIGRGAPAIVAAWGSVRRIDELLAEPTDPAESPGLAPLAAVTSKIQLEEVSFAYDGVKQVALLFTSLEIKAGESVAFVGPSGSGKSTVLSLIARFYDPTSGRVLYDGVDGRTVSAASIRAQMAFVMQDTFLFDTSIRENIRLGRADATDEEIERAAREAEIHDTIAAMPNGYDTLVGERGGRLSGGQRQRVAIARALVRKPSFLLLDETSSALDPVSEAAINETLARAGRGRTTISVTHRLAGAVASDRIFVVKDKRIVEQGTHDALLKRGKIYAELWEKQRGFVLDGSGTHARMSVERLRAIALFRPLSDAQLESLSQTLVSQSASGGSRVITEGETGSLFYVIARGKVRVTHNVAGSMVELARLDDGDQFGELALLRDAPRNATVTCISDSVFLTLTREHFLALIESTPGLRQVIEQLAAERSAKMRGTVFAQTMS